jgi:hypothetical protein
MLRTFLKFYRPIYHLPSSMSSFVLSTQAGMDNRMLSSTIKSKQVVIRGIGTIKLLIHKPYLLA